MISTEDLRSIFGESMPIDAWALVTNPGGRTRDQLSEELKAIARRARQKPLTPFQENMAACMRQLGRGANDRGEVRWLLAVNWVVSALTREDPAMDASKFYRQAGVEEFRSPSGR